ncbi:MAG TPA: hypothetical protein VGM13_12755 [Thermoanaerobaculia bacterium]
MSATPSLDHEPAEKTFNNLYAQVPLAFAHDTRVVVLQQELGLPRRRDALGLVFQLLLWGGNSRPEGRLDFQHAKRHVAGACEWNSAEGTPEQLWEALVTSGFIVSDGETHYLADWDRLFGAVIRKRLADSARK